MTPLVALNVMRSTFQKASARSTAWTPTEAKIFTLFVWAPVNVDRTRQTTYVAGIARTLIAAGDLLQDAVAPEIRALLVLVAEAFENGGGLSDVEVHKVCWAIDALHPRAR